MLNAKNTFFIVDVDECTEKISECDHNCTNTLGSYTCSCSPGYQLIDKTKCSGMLTLYWSPKELSIKHLLIKIRMKTTNLEIMLIFVDFFS